MSTSFGVSPINCVKPGKQNAEASKKLQQKRVNISAIHPTVNDLSLHNLKQSRHQLMRCSRVHPTEIRTSISPSSAVELITTSALANYATEAGYKKSAVSCHSAPKKPWGYCTYTYLSQQPEGWIDVIYIHPELSPSAEDTDRDSGTESDDEHGETEDPESIVGSPFYCESDALDHAATDVGLEFSARNKNKFLQVSTIAHHF
uniref:(California timema) hypothetical protein n=1 Tax=Timema californicum TaxID=61474 RepID=A0A7R9J4L7_TIMCA|nr:unnamed protein product [Timema californicum]